jgi:hypothetical protein
MGNNIITIVARGRRRGDRPPHSMCVCVSGKYRETRSSNFWSVYGLRKVLFDK